VFLPTIIKGLSYKAAHAQLLAALVYVAATIACRSTGFLPDKTDGWHCGLDILSQLPYDIV
jgi:hypothetical protein